VDGGSTTELSQSSTGKGTSGRPCVARGRTSVAAFACLAAGVLPVTSRSLPGGVAQIGGSALLAVMFLTVALVARRSRAYRRYWELPLAFAAMALFVLLDATIPPFVGAHLLHDTPVSGNPLASTVHGSIVIQLVETAITVVLVLLAVRLSGGNRRSVYLGTGRLGQAYVIGIAGFVAFYLLTARVLSNTHFIPVNGTVTLSRYVSMTPALLVLVAANGFTEELLFRGLLMSRLNLVFGPILSTGVQAVIFAAWHIGVTYTPLLLMFLVLVVFPLGLIAGYLTRSSNGIVAPSIFHAGADIPIYVAFLSYVS
jgi:membrane protease YdiL (CAAX protease family)